MLGVVVSAHTSYRYNALKNQYRRLLKGRCVTVSGVHKRNIARGNKITQRDQSQRTAAEEILMTTSETRRVGGGGGGFGRGGQRRCR